MTSHPAMPHHPIPIFSERFGDYYFSLQNGYEETKYVFLKGNNLPKAWEGKDHFTIAETGFGTGMNFLSAWELFEQTARPGQKLHYIGAELYPLDIDILKRFLMPLFGNRAGRYAERFLASYPYRTPGFHRLELSPNVTLTLVFDDVCDAFSQFNPYPDRPMKNMGTANSCNEGAVDCWFLDGFVPSGNPQMWREELFELMARHSHPGTSLASFTAAGFVRRGLQKAGFDIQKVKGYGKKREMIIGHYAGDQIGSESRAEPSKGKGSAPLKAGNSPRVAIIGGGLAGAAAGYALKKRGFEPIVYDKAPRPAMGASGNPVGLFNPRPFAMRHARCDYHTMGLEMIARTAREISQHHDIDYRLGGCLHLGHSETLHQRHVKAITGMGWPADMMKILSPAESSSVAGISIDYRSLYSPLAGALSPPKLVRAYLDGVEFQGNHNITAIHQHPNGGWRLIADGQALSEIADFVILTRPVEINSLDINSPETNSLETSPIDWRFLLRPVKGQITEIQAHNQSISGQKSLSRLRCNIAHGGYLARYKDDRLILGATFLRGQDDENPQGGDDYRNYYQLRKVLPSLARRPDFTGRRASVRLTTPDHMPLVGPLAQFPGVFLSAGYGSHGLLGTILGGTYLADMLSQTPSSLPYNISGALNPHRFLQNNEAS